MYSVRELLYAMMLPSGKHACMYRSRSNSIYRFLLTLSVRKLLYAMMLPSENDAVQR